MRVVAHRLPTIGQAVAILLGMAGAYPLPGAGAEVDRRASGLRGDIQLELDQLSAVDKPAGWRASHLSYGKLGFNNALELTGGIELYSGLMLEPVQQSGDDTSMFERHGLFAEAVGITWSAGGNALWLGKFNPAFGLAWERAPGIFGDDFSDDYEITEKVGIAGEHELLPNAAGNAMALSWSWYQADRSVLSDSWITRRGRLELADGGAANTSGLHSGTVSVSGNTALGGARLGYHLGYRIEAFEDRNLQAQRGSVLGLEYERPTDGGQVRLLYEWVRFNHLDGVGGRLDYHTAGVEWQRGPVILSTAASSRRQSGGEDSDDTLFQLGLGYLLSGGGQVNLAWKIAELDGPGRLEEIGLQYTHILEYQLQDR